VFKENLKWGIKSGESVLIKAVYDTLFNFNVSTKVCLACYKTMGASTNKFIKTLSKIYLCNYLNSKAERLSVKTLGNDTCSVFTLAKNTVNQFSQNQSYFIVSHKGNRYLVDKDFKQITFKGYYEIDFTDVAEFILAKKINNANLISVGLLNLKEEIVIPFQYSEIKINTKDSLIISCSAIVRPNAEDDIFNFEGKKVAGYRRHIDMATKNFVIHKIYEPKEYYVIYNVEKKDEKILYADEIKFFEQDEILIHIKNGWYIYNMVTGEKKPNKQS